MCDCEIQNLYILHFPVEEDEKNVDDVCFSTCERIKLPFQKTLEAQKQNLCLLFTVSASVTICFPGIQFMQLRYCCSVAFMFDY